MMKHPSVRTLDSLRQIQIPPIFNGSAAIGSEAHDNEEERKDEMEGEITIHDASSYRYFWISCQRNCR
jgi:hypothetical protein